MGRIKKVAAECVVLLGLLICASPIEAQTVQQSGSVTQNHIATWATNGVIKDGGAVAANQSLMGGSATTTTAGNTVYCASAGCGATVATASQVPFTGTLSNLNASVATAPGSGHSVVVTVYTGLYGAAAATTLTCTIANTATSCTDATHQVNLPIGTTWTIQFAVGASATSTGGQAGGVQLTSSSPPTPTTPYVLQSGQITSGHSAIWTTNGVIQDGGTPVTSAIAPGPFTSGNLVYVNSLLQLADSGLALSVPQVLVSEGAATLIGNPTVASANAQAFTIQGLSTNSSPNAANDYLLIFNSALGALNRISLASLVQTAQIGGPVSTTGATNSTFSCGILINRSNSGSVMTDTLPASPPASGCVFYIRNADATAFYGATAGGATALDGTTNGYFLLGPGQIYAVQSDGSNYTTVAKPTRAKLAPGAPVTFYYTGNACSNNNSPLSQSTPWCDPQQCWNYVQANIDIGNNKGTAGVICQQLDSTVSASNNQGGANAAINVAGPLVGQNTLIGLTIQGNCATPANTVLHPSAGSIIVADDYAGLAITCMTVQVGTASAPVFTAQHHAFVSINDKVFVNGGAQTGNIMQSQDRGHIIQFGTLTVTGGASAASVASANYQSLVEVTGTITITNDTFTNTYQIGDGSVIVAAGVTYNASGATITNKYALTNGGFLNTNGACGSVPGTGTSVDGFSNCH